MAEAIDRYGSADRLRRRWPSWFAPVALSWANMDSILFGIMVTHGFFSLIIRLLSRRGLSKDFRDRMIMTGGVAAGVWATAIGVMGSAAPSGRILPWVRQSMKIRCC